MKAITIEPMRPNSARLEDVPEPAPSDGSVLVEALARADRGWLGQLITRREKPADFARALERRDDDIKVVVEFAA